jgi:hypothetical protein
MKHYELHAILEHLKDLSLVFDWDEETGEISGRDAEYIKKCAVPHGVADCLLFAYILSAEPLKSKTDMAAILHYNGGIHYELPEDLAPFYPQFEEEDLSDIDPAILALITY